MASDNLPAGAGWGQACVKGVHLHGWWVASPERAAAQQAAAPAAAQGVERDALEVYTAVRPSGRERELPARLPELSAVLHPHQRRAAAWMVDRETRAPAVRATPHSGTVTLKQLPRRLTMPL